MCQNEMEELRLVRLNRKISRHPSIDIVNEFEESIIGLDDIKIVPESTNKFLRRIARPGLINLFNAILPKSSAPIFYISMGISEVNRSILVALFSSNNYLFLFDAWPKHFHLISKIVKAYNITKLFVTSRESANKLRGLLQNTKVYWCPEGCNPNDYKPFNYRDKDIDVLQFGRRYDYWHNMVVEGFMQQKISYLYEKEKGQIVFNNRTDFLNGLGRTKISICFPMNITNNELSGGVSTMTNRYIQSMASKCLIVGATPDEMSYMFEYEPVIQIDYTNPVLQISDILKNFHNYIPLIERNYQECISKHSWENRWKMIRKTIKEE
jgi:hypothetical protein